MSMIYLDTETCGLSGLPVLLQWSEGFGSINIEDIWFKTPREVIQTIEKIALHPDGICCFNAAFDFFHIYKMWCIMKMLPDDDIELYDRIEEIAEIEDKARDYNYVLKPYHCKDLFLHARKGPYQNTMDRKDIRIRRIPTPLAYKLAKELEERIPLKDIYFARKKDKTADKWQVMDIKDSFGEIDPDWKDIVVKFAPSSALKALAADIGLADAAEIIKYSDIEVDRKYWPNEYGYAPFAKATVEIEKLNERKEGGRKNQKGHKSWKSKSKWKGAWPDVIKYHIDHWAYHKRARQYAGNDVIYTRELDKYFNFPTPDDDDSILAVMVSMVRWRGFKIDYESMVQLRQTVTGRKYEIIGTQKREIPTAPSAVKNYVLKELDPTEQIVLNGSTKKVVLEEIASSPLYMIPCPKCHGDPGDVICERCNSTGKVKHKASIQAQKVLDARKSTKEIELYDKLLIAGRFHASFKVIGALSSRMSGADKLNAQGVKKTKQVRKCFTLAWPKTILCGGDFDGFEVTIAEAFFNDPELRKDLLTCERCKGAMEFVKEKRRFICTRCGSQDGQTIHGLFGTFVYPPMTYDEIKATKGTEDDKYTKSKSGVFAMMYGGEGYTLETRLGVPIEIADKAVALFGRRYPNVGRKRKQIQDQFGSMRQPGGIGTKVEWHEPEDKIETMLGFARYFTLENAICKTLFNLAQHTPPAWREIKLKVQRRDRLQTAAGAVSSALYGAAFQLQSANKRAAGNHVIQGSGAQITKRVQVEIWNIQPCGIHKWRVQTMNVHDEILSVTDPDYAKEVEKIVSDAVESIRPTVPLIAMKWKTGMKNWAEK